jgi:hypothetical protein
MGYSLDGAANETIKGNITLTGLSDGTHTLIVYAEDTAGTTGASKPVTLKVETQAPEQEGIVAPHQPEILQSQPFPTALVAVVCMVSVAVAVAGLLVYFRKHIRKSNG